MTEYRSSFLSPRHGFQSEVCCSQFVPAPESVHISSQRHRQGLHVGNRESAKVGLFTPQNLTQSDLFRVLVYQHSAGSNIIGMKCQSTGMAEALSTRSTWL